ncbi:MAG: hypothetical protein NVS9B14_01600 [Candidatus Acidiferrum sp.]
MTLFDDDPDKLSGLPAPADASPFQVAPAAPSFSEMPPGDPFSYGAEHPQPYHFTPPAAGDLQIPWSWGHFICTVIFGVVSLLLVQSGFMVYYIGTHKISAHMSKEQFEKFALSRPVFAIGSMVVWYAILLLFLFITFKALYNSPLWLALRWRKLDPYNKKAPSRPWQYLLFGFALSFLVIIATAKSKTPEHAPIQEIMKNPQMAFAFMGMAVLIAPFVEETIFRGYLYPLFAKSFGIWVSIVLTGTLFGIMHGSQLGWAWPNVLALTTVGIVFTFVRSRSETVYASYLMHLGYNSTLALLFTIAFIASKYGKLPIPHS